MGGLLSDEVKEMVFSRIGYQRQHLSDDEFREWLGEFNIGHSIISRAVLTGIGPAVEEMKMLIETPL